jgi:hypothetical protein
MNTILFICLIALVVGMVTRFMIEIARINDGDYSIVSLSWKAFEILALTTILKYCF